MTDKKPPIILVPLDPQTDPVLSRSAKASYADGVARRAAAAREATPKLGNLAVAGDLYKRSRDGAQTIAQVAEKTRQMGISGGESSGILSPQTIAGMEALKRASDESRAKKETVKMEAPAPVPAAPPVPQPQTASAAADKKMAAVIDDLDELELERLMRGIQSDVINNKREQEHVDDPKNERCTEIDFSSGLATGEFTQTVDIMPGGKLKVDFRTITPMENQALRLWIFGEANKNPLKDAIKSEMYGLGLIVMAVTKIGMLQLPDHLERSGAGVYGAKFSDAAFEAKYSRFAHMPQQLIHSIGTHASWFDMRIRRMFTTEFVKNG